MPSWFQSAKAGPQESQALEVREKACRKDDLPLVEEYFKQSGFPQTHGPQWNAPIAGFGSDLKQGMIITILG